MMGRLAFIIAITLLTGTALTATAVIVSVGSTAAQASATP
jgi:hypothetical protein